GDAERLKQSHVLRMRATGVASDDDLSELVYVGPVNRPLFQGLNKITSLQARLLLAVDHDRLTAANRHVVNFCLAEEIRADGIDMGPFGNPVAVEHRLSAISRGDDDVLVFRSHLRTRHRLHLNLALLAHLGRTVAAMLVIRTEHLPPADFANAADRLALRARLLAAAEPAPLARVCTGR